MSHSSKNQVVTLFPHQDLKHSEILDFLKKGEKDILACMPPSSGKTKTLQYLACDLHSKNLFDLVIVIVPLLTIRDAWLRPLFIRKLTDLETFNYKAENVCNENLKNLEFWNCKDKKIYITSRASISTNETIEFLSLNRPDCSKILIICDEGHHHVEINFAGVFCKIINELGGASIRVTGTPWHKDVEVCNENTKVVSLSWTQYIRQIHPEYKCSLSPKILESKKVLVPFNTENIALAYSKEQKKSLLPLEFMTSCIKSLEQQWIKDGCPKTIINIPRVEWAKPLKDYFNSSENILFELGRRPNIKNFAGTLSKKEKKEISELLTYESDVSDYENSKIDVIISCARMDEGTDWPLCSHVYNVRLPDSIRQILQRWARAGRGKFNIVDYPDLWKDTQSITFFIPLLSEDAKEELWKEHREIALMMACFLENQHLAKQWCKSEYFDKFTENISTKKSKIETLRKKAIRENQVTELIEGNEIEQAEALVNITRILPPGEKFTIKELREKIKKKYEGKKYQPTIKKLLDLASVVHPEIQKEITKKTENIERKPDSIIKEELKSVFDEVATCFEHVQISLPNRILETICTFTAFDIEDLTHRLGIRWSQLPQWSESNIRFQAEEYRKEFGEYPIWSSGSWPGFGGMTWHTAHNWLKRNNRKSLAVFLGKKPSLSWQEHLTIVTNYYNTNGKCPGYKSPEYKSLIYLKDYYPSLIEKFYTPKKMSPRERAAQIKNFHDLNGFWPTKSSPGKLSSYVSYLRKNHPDILIEYGIPISATVPGKSTIKIGEFIPGIAKLLLTNNNLKMIPGKNFSCHNLSAIVSFIKNNPKRCQNLDSDPLICEIDSLTKIKQEIKKDCWLIKLSNNEKLVYFSEIKEEDEIDFSAPAVRTHYLSFKEDLKNPEKIEFITN